VAVWWRWRWKGSGSRDYSCNYSENYRGVSKASLFSSGDSSGDFLYFAIEESGESDFSRDFGNRRARERVLRSRVRTSCASNRSFERYIPPPALPLDAPRRLRASSSRGEQWPKTEPLPPPASLM